MQIVVKALEGGVVNLACEASDTIDNVKARLGGSCRLFKGRVFLKGASTLSDCGIEDGDTLRAAKVLGLAV
eukprot:1775918-Alexandrium_andersonii.AAC.1